MKDAISNKVITRTIEKEIRKDMFAGKVIVLYGARQVGKTTLAKRILEEFDREHGKYFDCQSITTHEFIVPDAEKIKNRLGGARIVVFDEAQYVPNIGLALKVFHDAYPDIQIIATGSSSFDLMHRMGDSMAGRTREYTVYPLSIEEMIQCYGRHYVESRFGDILMFGLYPGIVGQTDDRKVLDLNNLQSNVLYKDILTFDQVKKPKLLINILKLLALSIGSEVSLTSIAKHTQTTVITVERYIDVLEKMFILKRIHAYSTNPGVEVRRSFKVYFVDLGIRNSILNSFQALDLRNDIGALFENFFVMERIKKHDNALLWTEHFFWRAPRVAEIDLIEQKDGLLSAFECKWQDVDISKTAAKFNALYPGVTVKKVCRENVVDLLV